MIALENADNHRGTIVSRLKKVLEDHPLVLLAGVALATASTVSGAIGWFWSQSSELRELQHKTELQAAQESLEGQVSELNVRLASIERRVGDSKLYLDVLKIPISTSDINALPASSRRFGSGEFFASVPKSSEWKQSSASQLDVGTAMLGQNARKLMTEIENQLPTAAEKVGMLWVNSHEIDARVRSAMYAKVFGSDRVQMHPFLFAMPVDEDYVRRFTAQFAQLLDGPTSDDNGSAAGAAKVIEGSRGSSKPGQDGTQNPASTSKTAASDEEVETRVLGALESLSRDDLAGFLLMDALTSRYQLSMIMGGSLKVVSTQKKGNVFYMRTQLSIPTVRDASDEAAVSRVTLDEEVFFIGTLHGGLLVRSGIPSTAQTPDTLAWTTQMLTSLRVVVD